ncbi:MerR family transcriptional regulator [Roseivivax marinus]|uniref:MerR family transcriptional regulator n=1 Tax=Roseivivax marinus TaxID=1379903 RepID=UPI00273E7F0B|nr:helix-turn-helix domain-containing protein [Roseivivax marinus]
MTITNPRGYLIGVLSAETGVKIETIRYYERVGLMPEPSRSPGGNRQYDHDQLKRLAFIRRSRDLGFRLDEIRALLGMVDAQDISCGDVHALTMQHLSAVREKIARLRQMERVLAEMAEHCARGDVPSCPIVDALFADR